jgi:hypothetical protein
MRAADIAAALGGAHREGRDWRCICPIHCGGSLTLRDGRERLLIRCWAGCNSVEVFAELRRRGLTGRTEGARSAPISVRDEDRADAARRIGLARRIWDAARDARRTPVVRYFAGRGIARSVPSSLRWAPALRRPDGTYGSGMVARVDNLDGELIGVHRTWLTRHAAGNWRRRDRAMLGRAAGGAVRLAPAGKTLLVGEGVETVLAAMQATGLPGWAALSTSGMVALTLPLVVGQVIVLADHDANGAGERAARAAAKRWLAEGRRVRIALPPEAGTDMADVLAGRDCARGAEVGDVAA